jgi:hypothetical protein
MENNKIKPMTIYEFKELMDYNRSIDKCYWIDYCEIIIDDLGRIVFAQPSHTTRLEIMESEKYNIPIKEIEREVWYESYHDLMDWILSKENYIAVWFNMLIVPPHVNRMQIKTIKFLLENDYISNELTIHFTFEYYHYLGNVDDRNIRGKMFLNIFKECHCKNNAFGADLFCIYKKENKNNI